MYDPAPNFLELHQREVRRIPIPRTWMSMNIVEVKKGPFFCRKNLPVLGFRG